MQCYQEANVQKVVEQVVLFKEICKLWLADIRPSIKESSYIRYRNIISTYIIMPLGDIATSSIDYALLSSYVSELLSTGGKKKLDYQENSCRHFSSNKGNFKVCIQM